MKSFQDNEGRRWDLALSVDAVKRVKALTEIDLLEAVDGKLLERLAGDPVLLCDVIYAVCKPQADQSNITDEQFGRAMAGDAIDAATTALLEELVGFFPSRRRAVLQKAIEKLHTLEGMCLEAAAKALDSDALERVMQAELDGQDLEAELKDLLAREKAGDSSTRSPAPPASTPAPSPSAN